MQIASALARKDAHALMTALRAGERLVLDGWDRRKDDRGKRAGIRLYLWAGESGAAVVVEAVDRSGYHERALFVGFGVVAGSPGWKERMARVFHATLHEDNFADLRQIDSAIGGLLGQLGIREPAFSDDLPTLGLDGRGMCTTYTLAALGVIVPPEDYRTRTSPEIVTALKQRGWTVECLWDLRAEPLRASPTLAQVLRDWGNEYLYLVTVSNNRPHAMAWRPDTRELTDTANGTPQRRIVEAYRLTYG